MENRSYVFVGTFVNGKWSNRSLGYSQANEDPWSRSVPDRTATVDTYASLAEYDNPRKKKRKFAKGSRFVLVDIDPPKGQENASVQSLMVWVGMVLKRAKLTPHWITFTGRGIHILWKLNEVLTTHRWEQLTKALARTLDGVPCVDLQCTRDITRSTRIVGTTNSKNGQRVRPLVKSAGPVHTVRAAQLAWGVDLSVPEGTLPDPDDPNEGVVEVVDHARYSFRIMARDCPVLADVLKTGGVNASEPQWKNHLELAARAEDGLGYVHKISQGHPEYDPVATERKFSHRVAYLRSHPGTDPPGCTLIGEYDPKLCEKCPNKRIVRTPRDLGLLSNGLPLPPEFFKGEGGIKQRGNDKFEGRIAMPFDIEEIKLVPDPESPDGQSISFTMAPRGKRKRRTAVLRSRDINNPRDFMEAMSNNGLVMTAAHMKSAKGFFERLDPYLKERQEGSEKEENHLGWQNVNGEHGFSYAGRIFWETGEVTEHKVTEAAINNAFTVRGKPGVWLKGAQLMRAQNNHALDSLVLAGFSAPLIKFTGIDGGVLNVYSDFSGIGKTAALTLGLSIWAAGKYAMNHVDDTPLSVVRRMGFIHSLPAAWDDLSQDVNIVKFAGEILFRLAQGQEKSRLRSDMKFRDSGSWCTLLALASNVGLLDLLIHNFGSREAALMRVFEMHVAKRPIVNLAEGMRVFGALQDNHGHVGAMYAPILAKQRGRIKDLVQKCTEQLETELQTRSAERFWLAEVSILWAASIISNTLVPVYKVDPGSYKDFLIETFEGHRKLLNTRAVDPSQVLNEFLSALQPHRLIVEGSNPTKIKVPPDRTPPLYEIDETNKQLLIVRKAFTNWCVEHHYNSTAQISALRQAFGAQTGRGRMGEHTPYAVPGVAEVLTIDLNRIKAGGQRPTQP